MKHSVKVRISEVLFTMLKPEDMQQLIATSVENVRAKAFKEGKVRLKDCGCCHEFYASGATAKNPTIEIEWETDGAD